MRKIETQMNQAIRGQRNWAGANTTVFTDDAGLYSTVYLHGNKIASYSHVDRSIEILDGGWQSNTTKSRLNALLSAFTFNGLSVVQKNWNWFIRDNDFNKRPVPFVSGMTV